MKKILSLILLISILFSTFAGMGVTANSEDGYPYSVGVGVYVADKWGFYQCECTSYCAYKLNTNGIYFHNTESHGYKWGHANHWDDFARSKGITVNSMPAVGSIAYWDSGETGHVAWVSAVNGGNITIQEYNYGYVTINGDRYGTHKYNSRVISSSDPTGYIHFKCATHTWDKGKVTTQATCTSDGVKTYTCTVCGETKTETIKGGHKYKVIGRVRATFLVNGAVGRECTVCGKRVKTIVYRPKSVVSNKSRVTYNGKYQYPGVTVKDVKGNVISPKYYTRSYKNNLNAGIAVITVNFKGLYSGTKSVAFKIAPKGNALRAVKTAGYSAINVYWNKQTVQTGGYQIQYSTDSKFSKNNKSFTVKTNTSGKKVTGLKSSTKYYFRIRTYKKALQIPVYSGWSRVLSAKTSTPPPTWVKPLFYTSYNDNFVFAEKIGKYYCYIDKTASYSSPEKAFLYTCSSANGTPKKTFITSLSSGCISDSLTDGNGNIYYSTYQFNGSNNEYGTVYKFSNNGKKQKVFAAKNLKQITGIYAGNIYYLKHISGGNSLSGVSDVQFCKYNIKAKKSYIIKKKAFNLYYNSDSNGRYMLFEGQRNPNGFVAQSVPITLYDAKTNKFYKISNRGSQSVISGGRVYYTDMQTIYTDKTHSKEMTCIISNSVNGKNQKCEAKLSSSYIPCLHICRHCVYFADNGMSDYYAYIFKSKKFVKVNTDGKYIIEIK